MRNIDPYTLHLFAATAKQKSIAQAAAREHIAASALSRRIAELERTLGVPLIVRSSHGISLTDAGELVVRRSAGITRDLQSLVREVHGLGGRVAGPVRLDADSAALVGFLPERLKRFIEKHRQVKVSLKERMTEEGIRDCLDDRADVVVGEAVDAPGTLEQWPFAIDWLVAVMPRGHPLAKKRKLRFVDVLRYPIVVEQSGGALDRLLHKKASDSGKEFQESVSVISFEAGSRMVQAGLGITVKPKATMVGTRRAGLVIRPLQEDWARYELRLYALHKIPRLPAVQALIEALRD